MAYPNPVFPTTSADPAPLLELLSRKHPSPARLPKQCACPYCQGVAKRVKAKNEDGSLLVLAAFDEKVGLDIEHDGLAAYQCQTCFKQVFLAP